MERRWALSILGALAFQLSLALLPVDLSAHLAFVVAFGSVAAVVLFTSVVAPTPPASRLWMVLLPIGGLVALGLRGASPGDTLAGAATMVCLLAAGTLIGAAVGSRIQSFGHLAVVAYVSSLADLYSALTPTGVTAQLASDDAMLAVVAVPWPMVGFSEMAPILGAGDVVMSALYLAAVRVHGRSMTRAVGALGLGYAVVLGALLALEMALPALPALGLALVLAFPESLKVPAQERSKALAGIVLLTVLAVWLSQR